MLLRICLLVAFMLLGLTGAGPASAATTVEVLDTYPSGNSVTLGRNERFRLRLAYSTDTPAGIWIAPYYRGKRVNAGTSPSSRHSGQGETIAWFFFMEPGAQVDEIRITAGDGGVASTPVVATHRVRVFGAGAQTAAEAPPPWVSDLEAHARAAQRQAIQAQRNQPPSSGDFIFITGFMLAVLVLGVGGLVAPAYQFARWRGGWRVAAAVPLAVVGFVVLRIVFDVMRDPTSHNLWPFEVLMAGAFGAVAAGVLALCRRVLAPS